MVSFKAMRLKFTAKRQLRDLLTNKDLTKDERNIAIDITIDSIIESAIEQIKERKIKTSLFLQASGPETGQAR